MKTINIEGVAFNETLVDQLKYIQGNEVNALLMENTIRINGFLVDQLNYNAENNRDYIDCLQSLNVIQKLIQAARIEK